MKNLNNRLTLFAAIAALMLGLTGCFPEEEDLSLGTLVPSEFTVTDISTDEQRNTYLLTSTSEGAFTYRWDLGNGVVRTTSSQTDTAFYDSKGTYVVTLTVLSEGGHSISQQEIVVEQDASLGVNVVQGGEMDNESDWNFISTGSTMTTYNFVDGAVVFTNDGDMAQTNIGMWQAVELEGGTTYQFSAYVKGSGMNNSWMEVLILDTEPVEGQDPSNAAITGLNTWAGCGVGPFEGTIPAISCVGDGKVIIANTGTYYLFIKMGSWDGNLGAEGLTVDDIKLVGQGSLTPGDNIIQGSSMDDPSAWTVINVGLNPTTVEFTDGVMKFSNGTESVQTNIGVWQAIEVKADQIYQFTAQVEDPGSSGSWKEFYLGTTEPTDGVDYTDGAITSGGTITFAEAGTVYVLIKVGSWDGNLGADGVTIDDVELVELN